MGKQKKPRRLWLIDAGEEDPLKFVALESESEVEDYMKEYWDEDEPEKVLVVEVVQTRYITLQYESVTTWKDEE